MILAVMWIVGSSAQKLQHLLREERAHFKKLRKDNKLTINTLKTGLIFIAFEQKLREVAETCCIHIVVYMYSPVSLSLVTRVLH